MPFLRIVTNVASPEDAADFIDSSAELVALALGKPASVMMSLFECEKGLRLGGSEDPAVLVEVEGIELDADVAPELSTALFEKIEQELEVPSSRVFIKFHNIPRGQWAGFGKVF